MMEREYLDLPKGVSDLFQLFKPFFVSLWLPLLKVQCSPTVLIREVNQVHLQGKHFNTKVRKMSNQRVLQNISHVHLLNALLSRILCLLGLQMVSLKLDLLSVQ